MSLQQPFPGHTEKATFADLRRDLEGLIVRDVSGVMRAGVFPDHVQPLVTGRADMRVTVADFRAVQTRHGAVLLANVGADTSVQLQAAPSANRRIDLVYVTMRSAVLGDADSSPTFGVVTGVPSPSPSVPVLPPALAAALPLATVEVPAGATATQSAGVVITQVYPFTAAAGGVVVVRNAVELAAWTPADGGRAYNLADSTEYVRVAGGWRPAGSGLIASGDITAQSTIDLTGLAGYDRYEITLHLPSASAASDLSCQLLAGGVADASAAYDRQLVVGSGSVSAASAQLAQTAWGNLAQAGRTDKTLVMVVRNLGRPERTVADYVLSSWDAAANSNATRGILRHRTPKAFDGVRFTVSAGTVTGRYEVRAV